MTEARIQVRTGRRWRAEEADLGAVAWLNHNRLVRVVTRTRAGLQDLFLTPQLSNINGCMMCRESMTGQLRLVSAAPNVEFHIAPDVNWIINLSYIRVD